MFQNRKSNIQGNIEKIVGYEALKKENINLERWHHPIKVKYVVSDTIKQITKGDYSTVFAAAEVYKEIIKRYPDINRYTVGAQIMQDCVNHTSRKHYPSGQRDLYFLIEKGKFRLYNQATDGKWNSKGEKIS